MQESRFLVRSRRHIQRVRATRLSCVLSVPSHLLTSFVSLSRSVATLVSGSVTTYTAVAAGTKKRIAEERNEGQECGASEGHSLAAWHTRTRLCVSRCDDAQTRVYQERSTLARSRRRRPRHQVFFIADFVS